MDENSNVVRLRLPDDVDDPLTEVLRAGARRLLAQAVDLEVDAFLAERADLKLPDGRTRLVRHGHGPEREVQTGIGAVAVARPKVRDRGGAEGSERIRFTSAILPRWSRRTIIPGFFCKITHAGRKTFMLSYRTPTGERRKPALGTYGQITVDQARNLAQDFLASVRGGADPSQERQPPARPRP